MTNSFPLVFTFKDIIAGNGFFAGVAAHGRVILTEEDAGYWMSGVNPGALAAGGQERSAAFRAFKERYLSVLFDIANEARSYEEFAREVRDFFDATDEHSAQQWLEARERVRAGELSADLPKVHSGDASIDIHLLQVGSPKENALDDDFAEAA